MQFGQLSGSATWELYQRQFSHHSEEMNGIIARNPTLLWKSFQVLEGWTPALQSLDDGQGANVTIDQSMVDGVIDLFMGIRDEATPALASSIDAELAAINFPSLVGATWTISQTRSRLGLAIRPISLSCRRDEPGPCLAKARGCYPGNCYIHPVGVSYRSV